MAFYIDRRLSQRYDISREMAAFYRGFEILIVDHTCVRLGSRIFLGSGSSLAVYIIFLFCADLLEITKLLTVVNRDTFWSLFIFLIAPVYSRFTSDLYVSDNFIHASWLMTHRGRWSVMSKDAVFCYAWKGNEKALVQFIPHDPHEEYSLQIGCGATVNKRKTDVDT